MADAQGWRRRCRRSRPVHGGGLGERGAMGRRGCGPRVGRDDEADALFPLGGARRPRRGRGPGVRPFPADPPPRHQAVEPAPRRRRYGLDHRLRPRHRRGVRRLDRDGRRGRHAAVHGPGAVRWPVRPAERRLLARRDALRAAHPAADLRRFQPCPPHEDGGARGPDPSPEGRPDDPARPGDDHPEGDRQGAGSSLRLGRRDGRRPAGFPRGAAHPGATDRAGGAASSDGAVATRTWPRRWPRSC